MFISDNDNSSIQKDIKTAIKVAQIMKSNDIFEISNQL